NDTSPAAALKVNIAAARALPRQLRLRGLGGQVVIDFAPMPKRDRAVLEQVIRAAFKFDAEVNLAGWTTLGLYEFTRKRDRTALRDLLGGPALGAGL
ncbi:MAG: ribonuclease E/G, partial [Cypionkella sp.]